MNLLDQEQKIRKEIFEYFGYVEDWRILPLDDSRNVFWEIIPNDTGGGTVRFADSKEELLDEDDGKYYEFTIYTQRFLPKWIYRGADYTMVVVDTHVDGNKLLQILSNANEVK